MTLRASVTVGIACGSVLSLAFGLGWGIVFAIVGGLAGAMRRRR